MVVESSADLEAAAAPERSEIEAARRAGRRGSPSTRKGAGAGYCSGSARDGTACSREPSGSFDELAFLSSVVGKDPRASAQIEHRSSEPLLRASENIDRDDPLAESLLGGDRQE